jgi:hypothetical protein
VERGPLSDNDRLNRNRGADWAGENGVSREKEEDKEGGAWEPSEGEVEADVLGEVRERLEAERANLRNRPKDGDGVAIFKMDRSGLAWTVLVGTTCRSSREAKSGGRERAARRT